MTDDLGPLRGSALIPKLDGRYEGPIRLFGGAHVAVITRDGDGIRLRIHDGPYTPPSPEDQAEYDAWVDRNTRAVAG